MITTIFEYSVSDSESVLVKASAKSVDTWAEDLKIELPKGFIPPREVFVQIEKEAINNLKKEQSEVN